MTRLTGVAVFGGGLLTGLVAFACYTRLPEGLRSAGALLRQTGDALDRTQDRAIQVARVDTPPAPPEPARRLTQAPTTRARVQVPAQSVPAPHPSVPVLSQSEVDTAGAIRHFDKGVGLHNAGRVEEAIAQYLTAIRLDPTYAKAHHNLANAYADTGDFARAIPEYTKAIELTPRYALAYYNLGITLKDSHDMGGAARAYQTACSLEPSNTAFCKAARDTAQQRAMGTPGPNTNPPVAASTQAVRNDLVGTTWSEDGGADYQFLANGALRMTYSELSVKGTWNRDGNTIYIDVNDTKVRAQISGDRMTGEGSGVGQPWTWSARKLATGAVSPNRGSFTFENFYVAARKDGPAVTTVPAGTEVYVVFNAWAAKPGPIHFRFHISARENKIEYQSNTQTYDMPPSNAPGYAHYIQPVTLGKDTFQIFGEVERDGTTLNDRITVTGR